MLLTHKGEGLTRRRADNTTPKGVLAHRLKTTILGGCAFLRNLKILGAWARATPGWHSYADSGKNTSPLPASGPLTFSS